MTREEAIISIKEIKDFYGNKNKDGYALEFVALEKEEIEALDMAIKALQAEPVCEHFYKGYCSRFEDGCFRQCQAEPKHGEWKIDEYGIYHCPFCYAINNTVYKSFCPNCGARMERT